MFHQDGDFASTQHLRNVCCSTLDWPFSQRAADRVLEISVHSPLRFAGLRTNWSDVVERVGTGYRLPSWWQTTGGPFHPSLACTSHVVERSLPVGAWCMCSALGFNCFTLLNNRDRCYMGYAVFSGV